MKKNRTNSGHSWANIITVSAYFLIGILLSSCDDGEFDTLFNSTASVNYFQLSDVVTSGYKINEQYPMLGIFVDGMEQTVKSVNSEVNDPDIPYLNKYSEQVSFPYMRAGSNIELSNNQPVYQAYYAGEYVFRFAFANDKYTKLSPFFIETTVHQQSLAVGSYYCYYFADAPSVDGKATYQVIAAEQPQQKAIASDKVAVRLINVSPDAGTLSVNLQEADNSGEETAGLPQQLSYGLVPDYVLLGLEQEQNGLLVLNIYDTQTGELLLVTSVPAELGHSFEILLHGFVNEVQREVITAYDDESGITEHQKITVSSNFRATIRQTH